MTADRTEHAPFDELAVGWALHALEPEDESAFVAHLAGCERCAVTVAETRDVMSAMAADLPQPEPSEGLLQRIRTAVGETEQLPDVAVPETAPVAPLRVVSGSCLPVPRTGRAGAGPSRWGSSPRPWLRSSAWACGTSC